MDEEDYHKVHNNALFVGTAGSGDLIFHFLPSVLTFLFMIS